MHRQCGVAVPGERSNLLYLNAFPEVFQPETEATRKLNVAEQEFVSRQRGWKIDVFVFVGQPAADTFVPGR
jgi:hypothetical protein